MNKNNIIIQERDRALLRELGVLRIADRELVQDLAGFNSVTRVNTRLLKLTRARLLHRFFVGSVGAGRKAVYTLTRKGAALAGVEHRGISRRYGATLVGDLFVTHQLEINRVYAALRSSRNPACARLVKWQSFIEPLAENIRLIPDGYAEVEAPGTARSLFLEVDLGHESMKIWHQKAKSYLQLALTGTFAQLFGRSQFGVLVVAQSQRRAFNLSAVIRQHTEKIFWFSDLQSIRSQGLWSAVWHRPSGESKISLF